MTDDVYARAYVEIDGNKYYSELKKYSVLKYVYDKLGKTGTDTENQKLKDLLNSMLSYGADAQKYFDYKTYRLATDNYYQIKVNGGKLSDNSNYGLYKEGETVSLFANSTDKDGNIFAYWQDEEGVNVSGKPTAIITVQDKNHTYTAVYSVPTAGIEYDSNGDGTCIVVGLADGCEDKDITIPAQYNGETVTEIDASAFAGEDIHSITIPSTIESIGRRAFNNCNYLTDVYYQGTRAQWQEISIASNNAPLNGANIHCTDDVTYTVTFKDYDGRTIKSETVSEGGNAIPPANPTREGYTFSGWDGTYTNVNSDKTVVAVYSEDTGPRITVQSASAHAGDTNVNVAVSIKNNPGIIGMTLFLNYDESALELKSIQKGTALSEMTFTKPNDLHSGIRLPWDAQEVLPEDATNGEILILTFKVLSEAESGQYDVSLSYNNGAIIDNDMRPISIDIYNGTITVE